MAVKQIGEEVKWNHFYLHVHLHVLHGAGALKTANVKSCLLLLWLLILSGHFLTHSLNHSLVIHWSANSLVHLPEHLSFTCPLSRFCSTNDLRDGSISFNSKTKKNIVICYRLCSAARKNEWEKRETKDFFKKADWCICLFYKAKRKKKSKKLIKREKAYYDRFVSEQRNKERRIPIWLVSLHNNFRREQKDKRTTFLSLEGEQQTKESGSQQRWEKWRRKWKQNESSPLRRVESPKNRKEGKKSQ